VKVPLPLSSPPKCIYPCCNAGSCPYYGCPLSICCSGFAVLSIDSVVDSWQCQGSGPHFHFMLAWLLQLSDGLFCRLQSLQNAATRLVTATQLCKLQPHLPDTDAAAPAASSSAHSLQAGNTFWVLGTALPERRLPACCYFWTMDFEMIWVVDLDYSTLAAARHWQWLVHMSGMTSLSGTTSQLLHFTTLYNKHILLTL